MSRRLPPFAGLRAFEATARLGSVTGAAGELNVTQSAVSHQLKRLEDHLGVPLFLRSAGRIAPTAEARAYLAEVTELFDRLDLSTRRLQGTQASEILTIRATPAFTTRWLVPRLHRFQARHPDIDYDIGIGFPPTDLGATDVFIHWGIAQVPGAVVEPFFSSVRGPVASRGYLARTPPMARPEDLLAARLLHEEVQDGWESWFAAVGADPPGELRGPRFAHCELVLTAAQAGQGIALPYLALIDGAAGGNGGADALVRLFEEVTGPHTIYSIAYARRRARERRVVAFRDWLMDEALVAGLLS